MDTYEKKYKEALLKARDARQNTESAVTIGILEEIFPELKESEDEKIRKELIEHIKANKETGFVLFKKFSPDDIIAWLEKQGQCQVKESAISQHENKTCKENNDSLTSKDDMMIEETLYFLREYQQSNRCKDESGMQNSVSCEKWLKHLKERINEKQ